MTWAYNRTGGGRPRTQSKDKSLPVMILLYLPSGVTLSGVSFVYFLKGSYSEPGKKIGTTQETDILQ